MPHLLVFWVAPHVRQAGRETFPSELLKMSSHLEGLWV